MDPNIENDKIIIDNIIYDLSSSIIKNTAKGESNIIYTNHNNIITLYYDIIISNLKKRFPYNHIEYIASNLNTNREASIFINLK